ncbi:MAG: putative photosynthetic complex assembly protein PuhE [Pseudomonadota bacterium]
MSLVIPVLFVILIWWFSTGAVLWLATRSGGHPNLRLSAMTLLGVFGIMGVSVSSFSSSEAISPSTGYIGFLSALGVWAMIEFTFLTGMLTGPRSKPCPDDVSETERFRLAFHTISHHEYALVGALVSIGLISLPGGHLTSFATFALLWLLRISAKLTLFSGAPKFSLDLMPGKLAHMQTYFRRDKIGIVFWLSTLLTTAAFAAAIFCFAAGAVPPQYQVTAIMLTTLLGLGAIEHWFMVLPIADSALWQWAMPSRSNKQRSNQPQEHDRHALLITPGSTTARQSRTGAML